jgi:hypothetical protein
MSMIQRVLALLLVLIAVAVSGCDSLSYQELSRSKSPDSVVEAILVKLDTGATVGNVYEVYIAPVGQKPEKKDIVLRADSVEGLTLKWAKGKLLNIRYDSMRIFQFTSFWQSKQVEGFNYLVEIELQKKGLCNKD